MEQTVMYFAGTAARASAIPTPSTGMTTYIGVTGTATIAQLETYTNSQWQTPYGLTLVAVGSFTGASTFTMNNIFTSAFTNYVLVMDSLSISSSGNDILFQLTTGGTPAAGTSYKWTRAYQSYASAAWNTSASSGTSNQPLGWVSSTIGQSKEVKVYRPAVAGFTQIINNAVAIDGTYITYGQHEQATSYDGFRLNPDGAFTLGGVVRVYGLRNG
jgi:hypothetical protein